MMAQLCWTFNSLSPGMPKRTQSHLRLHLKIKTRPLVLHPAHFGTIILQPCSRAFSHPHQFLLNHSNTCPVHHCLCKSSTVNKSWLEMDIVPRISANSSLQ
jgi:hypothetical protein